MSNPLPYDKAMTLTSRNGTNHIARQWNRNG